MLYMYNEIALYISNTLWNVQFIFHLDPICIGSEFIDIICAVYPYLNDVLLNDVISKNKATI